MKRIMIIIVFTLFNKLSYSQTDLLSNNGFESDFTNWTQENDDDDFLCVICNQFNSMLWNYNNCNCQISLQPPNVYFGNQTPFSGSNYCGIIASHENDNGTNSWHKAKVGFHLNTALDRSKEYMLVFHVSKMDNSSATPYLKIYCNDEFNDQWSGYDLLYSRYVNNDGAPQNISWQEEKVLFHPDASDLEWLIFKVSNDFLFTESWAGVYLDEIHLYEACDYFLNLSGNDCQQSSGPIEIYPGPSSSYQGHTILYHSDGQPFHVDVSHNVEHIRIEIRDLLGITQKVIEKSSKNGIWESLSWDGGGNNNNGEAASATYLAIVDASNACSNKHEEFYFSKLNGILGNTGPVDNDLTNGHTIDINGPPAFQHCCASELTLNNFHYRPNQLGTNGQIGYYSYRATDKITFGPNTILDANSTVELIAPHLVILTPNVYILGNLSVHLTQCYQRIREPIPPNLIRNDLGAIPDSSITEKEIKSDKLLDGVKFVVYPNPSQSGVFHVYTDGFQFNLFNLKCYNSVGSCVFTKVAKNAQDILIDLSEQPCGLYFLKINCGSTEKTVKLVF